MSSPAVEVPAASVGRERDRILALLRRHHPELAARTVAGPSGSLLVSRPDGSIVEIGRLPRGGRSRWVVVVPTATGAEVREAGGPASVLAVLRRALRDAREGPDPGRVRLLRSPP